MPLRHSFTPTDNARLAHLCGPLDEHLRTIGQALDVKITRRGDKFSIAGATPHARQALALLTALYAQAQQPLSAETVQLAVAQSLAQRTVAFARAKSGLVDAQRVLKSVKGVAFTIFTAEDVVRHPLVARIVQAYDRSRP